MTLLDAREQRSTVVNNIYLDHKKPLVVVKGNVVGNDKNPYYMALVLKYFNEIITETYRSTTLFKKEHASIDGNYTIYVLDSDGKELKKAMIKLEESNIGRLIDIDVYEGITFSRSDFNKPLRKCLVCDKDAFVCIRSKAHNIDEILQKTQSIIRDFITDLLLDTTDAAIKEEVDLYPKFGLVSKQDNGCHKDMSYDTFIRSKNSLKRGIVQYIEAGLNEKIDYHELVAIGIRMEKDMFEATKGINTHKGAIFLLGVFLPVLAHSLYYNEHNQLIDGIKALSEQIIGDYYDSLSSKQILSNSDKIYLEHNIKGVRSEALNGLEKIFKINQNKEDEYTTKMNDLLYFMSSIDDTTIIHKSDVDNLQKVQLETKEILQQGGFRQNKDLVFKMSEEYKRMCISPGGSADMLILRTIYRKVYSLCND